MCSECPNVVELDSLHFHVRCDCHPDDSCTHGICDECLDEYLKEPKNNER